MQILKDGDDLTPHIGAKLQIEKGGHIYEGVLKGRSHVITVTGARGPVVHPWLLNADDGTEIHFVAPKDGWIIHRL